MSKLSNQHPALLFENQVCYPLYSAANAVVRAYRPLLDELDLTYLQYMVMLILIVIIVFGILLFVMMMNFLHHLLLDHYLPVIV